MLATAPPDARLADELEAFARREAVAGAWAGAASTLLEASRLSADRESREHRLLRGVDAMIGAGDLIQADAFARRAVGFAPGPLRDATMGYLAVLRGRPGEAEALLHAAWEQCDAVADRDVAAVVAQRLALHGVGRLRGDEVVEWARRSVELAGPDDPVRVEAEALLGLGLALQGRLTEGLRAYDSVLARLPDDVGVQARTHPDGHGLAVAGRGRRRRGADPARAGRTGCAAGRLGPDRGVVVRVVGAGGVPGGGVG